MLLRDVRTFKSIYLACGSTDLRKSVDGLANIVKHDFKLDPFSNSLYLFCNREHNRIKGLFWDHNGFCLCYKRLDGEGARFKWPKDMKAVRDIQVSQFMMLLNGLTIDIPRGFGDISARDF